MVVRNPGITDSVEAPCFLNLSNHQFCKTIAKQPFSIGLMSTCAICLKTNKNNELKCEICHSIMHNKCTNLHTLISSRH